MIALIIVIYIFNVFDMLCTFYLVKQYGIDIEGNPFGKIMLRNTALTCFYKVFVVAGALFALYVFSYVLFVRIALWVLFGVFTALTIYHFVILVYLKVKRL